MSTQVEESPSVEDTPKNVAGKDVSTQATEKDFRNSEDQSDYGEATSNPVEGKDIYTQATKEDFRNSEDQSGYGETTSNLLKGSWQTRISQLYDTKDCSDVKFAVHGRVFKAHRLVLATRSREFYKLLTGANAAYDMHIVDAENVTEAAFDIMLRFLYTDILETPDKKTVIEVYHCALTYKVQDLRDKCEEKMSTWNITTDEVCILLDYGLDVPSLRNRCMILLQKEGASVLSSPSFLDISLKTLRFVLESGVLENVPALQRIERVLEWYVHPDPKVADYAGARNKLLEDRTSSLLGRLGFENLELEEIAHVVNEYRGLITPEELVSFLQHNQTRDVSVLPDWCLPVSRGAS